MKGVGEGNYGGVGLYYDPIPESLKKELKVDDA